MIGESMVPEDVVTYLPAIVGLGSSIHIHTSQCRFDEAQELIENGGAAWNLNVQ